MVDKTGIKDKFALTRLAIQRAKELIKEKEKRILLNSTKITTHVLDELDQGKVKSEEELKKRGLI